MHKAMCYGTLFQAELLQSSVCSVASTDLIPYITETLSEEGRSIV